MNEDIFLPLLLAFGIFFAGYYGYTSNRWSFPVFTFVFAPVAGLLLGFSVMKIAFPELSLLRQVAVSSIAVVGTVVLLLLLIALMQRRR
jgi:hypothetical protein